MAADKAPKSALAALIGVAAASVLVPAVARFEGKRNDPYLDQVGKMTVCFGETNVDMRRYTDAECNAMLEGSLLFYASEVLKCTPSLKDRPNALAASVSLSYNIGSRAYCRSIAARRFRAGNIAGGCDAFLYWRNAGGRPILLKRRKAERQICLADAE